MLVDIISQIREEVVALAPCLHIRLTWVQPLVKVTAFASLMPKNCIPCVEPADSADGSRLQHLCTFHFFGREPAIWRESRSLENEMLNKIVDS
jgi:hypothetical protein